MAIYTKEEALEYIEENDVRFIRLAFSDMFGNHKNISIQPDMLEEAFDQGIGFDAFRVSGYDDPVLRDLFLVPDPRTLSILPWRPQTGGVVRFYCDVVDQNGNPFPYDARTFLKASIKKCKKLGFNCRVGLRSEFYLFRNDEEGRPTREPMDQGSYFDVAPLDGAENIRREICLSLADMGVGPKSSHHEAGPGQNEIDFKAANALDSADHFMTYKNVVHTMASRNGLSASFEPKPLEGKPGNGLHLRMALYSAAENLTEDRPEIVRSFMAGIYNRMRDITVFLNTQKDSYLRFGENEAPKYITWSYENQSRLFRVPMNHGKQEGFILRSPDSMMNPYLAFAMVIEAGLCGVAREEKLPEPLEAAAAHELENGKRYDKLPLSLAEAVECARTSSFLQEDEDRCRIATHFLDLIEKDML